MALTPAQTRVLLHCYNYPEWHSLLELDRIKLLQSDDVLTVPSLIEAKLLRYLAAIKSVAITASGQIVAEEINVRIAHVRESPHK